MIILIFLIEILRVSGKGDALGRPELERDEEGGEKKPRYRTYAGGIVTEEVVKLSDKVIVPVKEYPKVMTFFLGLITKCLIYNLSQDENNKECSGKIPSTLVTGHFLA